MTRPRSCPFVLSLLVCCVSGLAAPSGTLAASSAPTVTVEPDGTVQVPHETVPPSALLSPAARAYVAQHLQQMQQPFLVEQVNGVPRFMVPFLQRDHALFAVVLRDTRIGDVHVHVYTPAAGVAARNRSRVLVDLHGGGFSGCWPACAELESIPLAALMRIEVVAIDYREAPRDHFPAASEDVAAVYRVLLQHYPARNIGIYGCSAGGLLTAEAEAWFQTHALPSPGALGIYCSGAGGFGGDSQYLANPAGEARMPPSPRAGTDPLDIAPLGYFRTIHAGDPLAAPVISASVLTHFPPTLIITADRDFAFSNALYTHEQLVKAGVDAELHVWEGLFHGFFYNVDVPESRDAFDVMRRFFDRHLGR